jgi:hypothetical protein
MYNALRSVAVAGGAVACECVTAVGVCNGQNTDRTDTGGMGSLQYNEKNKKNNTKLKSK